MELYLTISSYEKYSEDKEQSEKIGKKEKRQRRKKTRKRRKLLGKQQEREKELIRIQEESNSTQRKRNRKQKDNYRPTFVINDNIGITNEKRRTLFRKYSYSTWNKDESKNEENHIGTFKVWRLYCKGTYENPIPDNFILQQRLYQRENIIWFSLASIKIYKYLNEYGNPLFQEGKS